MSSGTQASAHGGYTTVCAMPNLDPVPDSLKNDGHGHHLRMANFY